MRVERRPPLRHAARAEDGRSRDLVRVAQLLEDAEGVVPLLRLLRQPAEPSLRQRSGLRALRGPDRLAQLDAGDAEILLPVGDVAACKVPEGRVELSQLRGVRTGGVEVASRDSRGDSE